MSEHSLHEDIIVLSIQRREQSFHILYRHQSSMHYYPIRRLQNPRKSHQSLFIFTTHTPKNHNFFFLMFKLKFEAYIFPKFNTEPQLNRRIVKLFSHIELTLTTLFKLLLSFLSTIFSGTKRGIRKNKENYFQRERVKTLQRSSRVLGGEPSRAVFRASTGLDLPRIRNQSFLTFLGFRNSQCKIKETKRGFYKMITV